MREQAILYGGLKKRNSHRGTKGNHVRGNRHCPKCHSSHGFNLLNKVQVRLQCVSCGHIFPFNAVVRKCKTCGDNQPHFENRCDGKFHTKEVFGWTCLNCGRLTTKEDEDDQERNRS